MDVRQRTIATNGVELHVAEAGEGPVVVLCHGFPELAYSWRHQLPFLAANGYHALAPDQRGYGGSTCPPAVEDYDIISLTDDLVGLLDALGEERAVFVGHDWGAPVVWTMALRHPGRVRGVVGMSVAYVPPRAQLHNTEIWRSIWGDLWFYMLYFQEPGVADADLGRDAALTMRKFLAGSRTDGVVDPEAMAAFVAPDGRGMVERMPEPQGLPPWLSQEELDHFAAAFTRTGFTGALNWYRNLDRNYERTADLDGKHVTVPAAYIAGEADPAAMMFPPSAMEGVVDDLRLSVTLPGAGHWVQQERPDEVNALLHQFLEGLAP